MTGMPRPLFSLVLFSILIFPLAGCSAARSGSGTYPAGEMQVIAHPDGLLYVGDRVSFEVVEPTPQAQRGGSIQVSLQTENKTQELGSAEFAPFGIGKRDQATLWWVWDTSGLKPGGYRLIFTRLPDGLTWNETYLLHPESQVPPPEPEAHWVSTTSACCVFHYISGTAAARDIQKLSREADQESAVVAGQLNYQLTQPIDVTLMSRVVGQGGFTSNSVYLSYLDGNYAGNDMSILFHHEFVHYYDAFIGGTYRPSIFAEGLAVYLTGGHFKLEPLKPRAAALLDLGWYIPLRTVANDFYNQQHEISYLEGATLVKYLVDTYGWQAFENFYREIPEPEHGQSVSDVIEAALQSHFGISFSNLETAYLSDIRKQPFTRAQQTDLRLSVEYFDTVRRYQAALDPSAYFLTAWLPDGSVMRQRDIVADFLRHPDGWENRLSESLLYRAETNLDTGDYAATRRELEWTNLFLDLVAPETKSGGS
jgi:hypothetical protein